MGRTFRKNEDKFDRARKRLTNQVLNRIQQAFEEQNEDYEEIPTYRDRNDDRSTNYQRTTPEV